MKANWPTTLWIVRHGESAANLSSRHAEASGQIDISLPTRDMDTPLSALGEAQAAAFGAWFSKQELRPDVILSSPYHRTRQTLNTLLAQVPIKGQAAIHFDERLRERERGVFDGLTVAGVKKHLPAEYEKRQFLGKFYYRAPGGESWCDVVQRLRGLVDNIRMFYAGKHVMIVAHEVVIYCLRYIIEELDEAQILAIDAASDLANCSLTEYHGNGEHMQIVRWAEVLYHIDGANVDGQIG